MRGTSKGNLEGWSYGTRGREWGAWIYNVFEDRTGKLGGLEILSRWTGLGILFVIHCRTKKLGDWRTVFEGVHRMPGDNVLEKWAGEFRRLKILSL